MNYRMLRLIMTAVAVLCPAFVFAQAPDGPLGVERVARFVPFGYGAADASNNDTVRWVQIDLGEPRRIDKVKILPYCPGGNTYAPGYPVRFKIEASSDATFTNPVLIVDKTQADLPDSEDVIGVFPAAGVNARYVRLTATRLRDGHFSLSKIEVWSNGKDAAVGRPCSDSVTGDLGVIPLTREPRPLGEEVVTNNPQNVIPFRKWKPVVLPALAPTGNVHVADGVFRAAMVDNVAYLMNSYSADELVRPFRERAGKPIPVGLPPPIPFWDTDLPGSNAGRFLMGAGNTLQWMDDPDLRAKLNAVVNGIAECAEPNGYIMGYSPDTIFHSERANYTRSWVTHGLIAAGNAGNPEAYKLLRGFYDWFDQNPYLPEILRRAGQGGQGQIADTEVYFTPIGKPKDIQVVQQYYQENYWMDQLASENPAAIWLYPYDRAHNYLITLLEAYMDQYFATGSPKYLAAATGGWDLYHNNWIHIGGSVAITEGDQYPPQSYFLSPSTGELCGSGFWVLYNQRFSLLYPENEKYVAEIEKSIYNVGLANQVGEQGFRYHAVLVGQKEGPLWGSFAKNTCCEGQGTRLIGSLPKYIYSVAKDGVYIRLYSSSSIDWKQGGDELGLRMVTQFPYSNEVKLAFSSDKPALSVIRVRVPSWAAAKMPILVNGKPIAIGAPGSYASLSRTWSNGDVISFALPIDFHCEKYTGVDEVSGRVRYALEYGPILMALTGPLDGSQQAALTQTPQELAKSLQPISGQPLHFAIPGNADHEFMPYWLVQNETFTCFPIMAGPADQPVISDASWIWYPEGNPSVDAPIGARYFRKDLGNLTEHQIKNIRDAVITVTADNESTVYVNGKKAIETYAWQIPVSKSVVSYLKPGENVIAIAATNTGDQSSPAGLIAQANIDFNDGTPLAVRTDQAWQCSKTPDAGWTTAAKLNWTSAQVLGPYGMGPWNTLGSVR
jgi:DUF1680 family protein